MPGEAETPRPTRRMRKERGGRQHEIKVRLTSSELDELRDRAESAGVSVARLLVESTLIGDRQTVSQRRATLAAFMVARRQVSGATTNLNQLARVANSTQRVPVEVEEAAARMVRTVEVLESAAARVEAARR